MEVKSGDGMASKSQQSPPQNLRSSVSMFIEDSRITAVANAEPPQIRQTLNPSSFYSVSSFTSSTSCSSSAPSSTNTPPPPVLNRRGSWNLRPNYSQLPAECKPRPRACSSSPVRFRGGGGVTSPNRSSSREIIHNIIQEDEPSGPFGSFCQSQRRPPPPSNISDRKRTTLTVEPVISVINVREGLPPLPTSRKDDGRSYTSVNLTLRSPTSSGGPSTSSGFSGSIIGPTLITSSSNSRRGSSVSSAGGGGGIGRGRRYSGDICGGGEGSSVNVVNTVVDMEAGGTTFRHVHSSTSPSGLGGEFGGSVGGVLGERGGTCSITIPSTNLTYSTYSNSRDGFEAQVQIQFGPGGGTFTASRRRQNHSITVRQMNSDLLSAQNERKDKLRTAIHDKRCLLATLQTEIVQLRSQLQQQSPVLELENLKKENQRLRIECDFMSREVDLYQNGSVPLGETDDRFYQGINPGQSISEGLFGITNNRRRLAGGREGSGRGNRGFGPPPRPPPPKFMQSPTRDQQQGLGGGDTSPQQNPQQQSFVHSFIQQQQRQAGGRNSVSSPGGGDNEGDDEVGEGEEWTCSMCTFQNHRDLDYCEQCQMVRVKQPHQSLHGTN